MADSFFALKNSFPDEEYVDLEEEEYDALNDETFGSEAFGVDWEDIHNILVAATESDRGVDSKPDGVIETADVVKNLNRLVLDDDLPPAPGFDSRRFERNHVAAQDLSQMGRSPPMPPFPPKFGKVPTVEELERELLEGKRKVEPSHQPQAHVGPPHSHNHIVNNAPAGFNTPPPGLLPLPRMPPPVFPPSPNRSGFSNISPNKHTGFFPPGMDIPGRNNRGPPPQMGGKPPGMFPGHGQPPPHIQHEMMMRNPLLMPPMGYPMPPPHANMMRFLNPARNIFPPMFPQMRHDGYGRNSFHPPHPLLQQHLAQKHHQNMNMNRHMRQHQPTIRRNSENGDEYALLMNNRERTWLLNLQIMLLATDKPHIDDYYYMMWKKKHPEPQKQRRDRIRNGFHKEEQKKNQEPFFANNRNENNSRERKDSEGTVAASPKVYVPLQFENSLGKLQCKSSLAPRMLIDMDVVSEPQNGSQPQSVQKDQRKTKKILLELERLYLIAMEAEEVEENPEIEHEAESNELITKALTGFLNEERFLCFMCIRKGKTLLLRCLSRVEDWESAMFTDLWSRLLKGFPTIVRRDREDAILPKFYPYFKSWTSVASWPSLLTVARSLLSNTRDGRTSVMRASPAPSKPLLFYVLANQFGVSAVSRLLLQGELAATSLSDSDSETAFWKNFVEELVKNLSHVDSTESVAKPIEPIPQTILTAALNHRCSNLSLHLHATAKKLLAT